MTGETYSRDPRYVAKKAEAYLKQTGIADISYWGPEAEFYIFNDDPVRPDQHERLLLHRLEEGIWNCGRERRQAQPRLSPALQGGLLPGSADRQATRTCAPRSC